MRTNCISLIEGSSLMDEPPFREGENPHLLSSYSRFWSGATPWSIFLMPGYRQGPAINTTKTEAGVYEFGISMPHVPGTIIATYVGKSCNVRQRHLGYLNRGGDHISGLMGPILEEGCTVWQRVRYLKNDLQAQRWEARFLVEYDYTWNSHLNPPKRIVHLEPRYCCCLVAVIDVVTVHPVQQRTSVLSNTLKLCVDYSNVAAMGAQILCALTVILIVALRLTGPPQNVEQRPRGEAETFSECLLGTTSQGNSLCVYTYIVSGTSMALSLLFSILVVFGIKFNACGRTLNVIIACFMSTWWAIAAVVLTSYMSQANRAAVPKGNWRLAVVALSWSELGLWIVSWLLIVTLGVLKLCSGKPKLRNRYSETSTYYVPPPSAPTIPDVSAPEQHPQFATSYV